MVSLIIISLLVIVVIAFCTMAIATFLIAALRVARHYTTKGLRRILEVGVSFVNRGYSGRQCEECGDPHYWRPIRWTPKGANTEMFCERRAPSEVPESGRVVGRV